MDRGNQLFAKEDYRAALEAYQAAYKLYESSKIAFNIARSAHKLGQLLLARKNYIAFIDSQKSSPTGAAAAVEASEIALKELDLQLASVRVLGTPRGATVRLGEKYQSVVDGPTIYLVPGSYNMSVVKEGFSSHEQLVRAQKGQNLNIQVALEEVQAPTVFYKKTWFWSIVGAVALAGAATGIAVAASSDTAPTELGMSRWEDWDAL